LERLRVERRVPQGCSELKARSSKLKMAELVQYYGTGRRKRAIARVYLRPGSGDFKVNGRAFDEYFVTPAQRASAKAPLGSTDSAATFNIVATVLGGGVRGQADAVKLGIARALMQFNAELRGKLKSEGMVTRDPREKERKKYGQKGARKRFQFSKR
jgi:small subunit ribosomal protein S9